MNMKSWRFLSLMLLLTCTIIACKDSNSSSPTCGITTTSTGAIITNLQANGTGGGSPFDALVETAWGDGNLDLHRGHAPIQSVLEAYLGISHNEMHVMMENCNMNLSAVCTAFGFDPENLVETLTASFVPFIEKGVTNGVITSDKVADWTEKVRTQFRNRVNWEG